MALRGSLRLVLVVLLAACGESAPDPDAAAGADGSMAGADGSIAACEGAAGCDDGLYCNGGETCAPGGEGADARGCVAGTAPCAGTMGCDEEADVCTPCDEPDADDDGHDAVACGGDDCDDADGQRYPGNSEVCDDDGHDEDCGESTVGDRDADGDGFVDIECCNGSTCADDCDDAAAGVHPTAGEVCDGLDNDCDGTTDESVQTTYYLDNDNDGHGQDEAFMLACAPTGSYRALTGGDCDDTTGAANPGATEICDGIDNDCDDLEDEDVLTTYYLDGDGDMFGVTDMAMEACAASGDYRAIVGDDCDDSLPGVNPGTAEACDGLDTDCDPDTWAAGEDDDGDDVADVSCGGTDCDDARADVYPGAPELCDGLDNDCSGPPLAEDRDGDHFAARDAACDGGPYPKTDCYDLNENVRPTSGGILGPQPYYSEPYCRVTSGPPGFTSPCQRADGTWTCISGTVTVCLGGSPSQVAWDWNCDDVEEPEPAYAAPATCPTGTCTISFVDGFCAAQTGSRNLCSGSGPQGQGPTYGATAPPCGSEVEYAGCCCSTCGDPPIRAMAPLACR